MSMFSDKLPPAAHSFRVTKDKIYIIIKNNRPV